MTLVVECILICDGVWTDTTLGSHEFGPYGLYAGECRSGRNGNASLTREAEQTVLRAAKAAGWFVRDAIGCAVAQCPDCHALSPIPAEA